MSLAIDTYNESFDTICMYISISELPIHHLLILQVLILLYVKLLKKYSCASITMVRLSAWLYASGIGMAMWCIPL